MSTTLEKTEQVEEPTTEISGEALLKILDERYEHAKREGGSDNVDEVFERIMTRIAERRQ